MVRPKVPRAGGRADRGTVSWRAGRAVPAVAWSGTGRGALRAGDRADRRAVSWAAGRVARVTAWRGARREVLRVGGRMDRRAVSWAAGRAARRGLLVGDRPARPANRPAVRPEVPRPVCWAG
ncbi:hypothetical protein GCM10010256_06150 [Streptomyces coeruleorubidus]|nr:hypothetical protein GCM10010256_06150 [Streptomyces coeruleorubidus]